MAPRLGPLRELPLADYLPPDHNVGNSSTSPIKRPASPGNSLTPSKKRNLREERSSPRATAPNRRSQRLAEAPIVSLQSAELDGGRAINRNAAFGRIGPSSVIAETCKDWSFQDSSRHHAMEVQTKEKVVRVKTVATVFREQPPSPDRKSEHYPGFDVYFDTKVRITAASDFKDTDKPDGRENTSPKQKVKAGYTVASPSQLKVTGKSMVVGSTPATLMRKTPLISTHTPRPYHAKYAAAKSPLGLSPGIIVGSKAVTAARRLALQEELDEVCSEVDENDAYSL